MQSIKQYLLESTINEKYYELEYDPITWDLVDLVKVSGGADGKLGKALFNIIDDEESADFKFYIEFIEFLQKCKATVWTEPAGNLFPETTMHDLLVELEIIKDEDTGFVLNKDGDDETSTFCTFGKRLTSAEKKKLEEYIAVYNQNPFMTVAETF